MSAPNVFSEYAQYYDLLYRDKDYVGEADYVHRLIQRCLPGARTVLELGSGTGRHAAMLAKQSYAVHGIERSEEMLCHARALAETKRHIPGWPVPTFTHGDIRTTRVGRTFDAAISLFHVISYQVANDDLLAAFRTARAHMSKEGVFLFDAWYGPAVLTDRPSVRVKRMEDEHVTVTRLAEPVLHADANTVDVNYHVFIRNKMSGAVIETRETHTMRYLFCPEIEMLASQTGFIVVRAEEWMTGRSPGCTTWGVCFVAQAV